MNRTYVYILCFATLQCFTSYFREFLSNACSGSSLRRSSLCSHCTCLSTNPLVVVGPVLAEASVSLSLGRVLDVRVVQEVLNAEENLLDSDGRAPVLLLIEDGEAHRAAWVDIGVEERGHKLDLGRSGGEIVLEDDLALVEPSLPRGSLLARDAVLPEHKVHGAICILHWPGNESKGMILPPAFSLLREPGLGNSRHFVSTILPLL